MDKLAYNLPEFCEATGIGKDAAYKLVRSGEIKARKVGQSWIIPRRSIEEFLEGRQHVSLNDRPERLAALGTEDGGREQGRETDVDS
jgi:excisionase family DNA binding protein